MDENRSYVSARTGYTGNASQAGSLAPQPLAQPQPAPHPPFYRILGCIECYNPKREVLEYDYSYDDVNGNKPPQSYPRIRERGEYYIDSYNSEPWSVSFGTTEAVSKSKIKILKGYGLIVCLRSHLTSFYHLEWNLVQQFRSSRFHHVGSCLALVALFSSNCHSFDNYGGYSCIPRNGIQRTVRNGIGMPCQDIAD